MSVPSNTAPLSVLDDQRGASAMGGFNFTALRLEITRVLRNRRTLFFIVVFPCVFFFLFTAGNRAARGPGGGQALAYVMISMAVYGAMVGTTSGGASVAVERALGWSRQLRLTPLTPAAYVFMKVLASMTLGLISVCSTFTVGALNGVHMPPQTWLMAGVTAWLCSSVFAAFGLFVGFLFPAENVMQFVGPLMAFMAMFGGLFVPLNNLPQSMQDFARYTPMYGVGTLARAPLIGGATPWAVGSVVVWAIIFAVGAMIVFKRDTQRV
ncbi:MAG: ABC transporter permease [Gemmatimonadaceae bacterium]